jgi:hypothetical protein
LNDAAQVRQVRDPVSSKMSGRQNFYSRKIAFGRAMAGLNAPVERRVNRGLVLAILAAIALVVVGIYILVESLGESTWFLRIALLLFATSLGFRLGREIDKRRRRKGWLALGFAVAGLGIAGFFAAIQPALRDRERDREYAKFFAEGQSIIAALDTLARDAPDETKRPTPWELGQRDVESLRRAVDWLDRYSKEIDRYTSVQRKELEAVAGRIVEESKAARETLDEWIARSKKL